MSVVTRYTLELPDMKKHLLESGAVGPGTLHNRRGGLNKFPNLLDFKLCDEGFANDLREKYKKQGWKKAVESDAGTSYERQDYTEQELDELLKYPVTFSDDGNSVSWVANYGSNDNPAVAISRMFPNEKMHYSSYTESKHNGTVVIQNGNAVENTPKTRAELLDDARKLIRDGFEGHVPESRAANTLYGELIRNISRVDYGYQNEGAMIGPDYGPDDNYDEIQNAARYLEQHGSWGTASRVKKLMEGPADDYKENLENLILDVGGLLKDNKNKLLILGPTESMQQEHGCAMRFISHELDKYVTDKGPIENQYGEMLCALSNIRAGFNNGEMLSKEAGSMCKSSAEYLAGNLPFEASMHIDALSVRTDKDEYERELKSLELDVSNILDFHKDELLDTKSSGVFEHGVEEQNSKGNKIMPKPTNKSLSVAERFQQMADEKSVSIERIWQKGNRALQKSIGENYDFLEPKDIGTAMLTDDKAMAAIKNSITDNFGKVDGRTLGAIAKSVASGSYFEKTGQEIPTPIPYNEINAKKDAEKVAKAKQVGRDNPILQKLMPGNLKGKFMGKTGKFTVEYPEGAGVAKTLNSKIRELSDYVDDKLGNEEYSGNEQRIFISKELQKDGTSVCAVMYHGFEGGENKDIAEAVKASITDMVPDKLDISKTYPVLNTELRVAEGNYAVQGFDISEHAPLSPHIRRLQREAADMPQLNESLVTNQPDAQESMQMG